MPEHVLAFDIGATKIAWGIIDREGTCLEKGSEPTPAEPEPFLEVLTKVAKAHPDVVAIGVGIAGLVSANDVTFFTNLPKLSNCDLGVKLKEMTGLPVRIDNDGRCALIGEVWLGAAQDTTSAVLITVGTGIGGAVMQKGVILPHPTDISKEIASIIADPSDLMPCPRGRGCIEALIGGKNIEARFEVSLREIATKVREGDEEAVELWDFISDYFLASIRAIYETYSCKMIIVGGIGSKDLEYYLQDTPPCTVVPATLGAQAGLYGAAQIGFDAYAQKLKDESDDWD